MWQGQVAKCAICHRYYSKEVELMTNARVLLKRDVAMYKRKCQAVENEILGRITEGGFTVVKYLYTSDGRPQELVQARFGSPAVSVGF